MSTIVYVSKMEILGIIDYAGFSLLSDKKPKLSIFITSARFYVQKVQVIYIIQYGNGTIMKIPSLFVSPHTE